MLDKLCTAIANTLSLKKNYLHEIQKIFESKIIPQKDRIEIDELMKILSNCFSELSAKFEEFQIKFECFNFNINNYRLPEYLYPTNLFLGKYLITEVVSYNDIYDKNLMSKKTCFSNLNRAKTKHMLGSKHTK